MITSKQLIENLRSQGLQQPQIKALIGVIQKWLDDHYPVLAELSKKEWKEIKKAIEGGDRISI